jgi:hypothetical protein
MSNYRWFSPGLVQRHFLRSRPGCLLPYSENGCAIQMFCVPGLMSVGDFHCVGNACVPSFFT